MIMGIGEKYPKGRGQIGDKYIQYHRGHSKDQRDKNIRDYNPFQTQPNTKLELEDREHIISDTEAKIERIMGDI
jgi:hypothetical protein